MNSIAPRHAPSLLALRITTTLVRPASIQESILGVLYTNHGKLTGICIISLERSNSGHTPRIRPHATTLNIPGMTRSRASPDGRIPDRDVASKLVVVMVGLPARGKSYITKKIQRYLAWQQHSTEIFNVGNRRRVAAGRTTSHNPPEESVNTPTPSAPEQAAAILLNGVPAPSPLVEPTSLNLDASGPSEANDDKEGLEDQSASFFNPKNESAAKVRDQLALNTLDELLDYLLRQGGSVGILDATNSTISRRKLIVDHIKAREPKLGILFIESVCTDKAVSWPLAHPTVRDLGNSRWLTKATAP